MRICAYVPLQKARWCKDIVESSHTAWLTHRLSAMRCTHAVKVRRGRRNRVWRSGSNFHHAPVRFCDDVPLSKTRWCTNIVVRPHRLAHEPLLRGATYPRCHGARRETQESLVKRVELSSRPGAILRKCTPAKARWLKTMVVRSHIAWITNRLSATRCNQTATLRSTDHDAT